MTPGAVYWFTGLSGAGKTTLANRFCERLRAQGRTVVFLDGDDLRDVFGNDLGHSLSDRFTSAMRNARLCRLLASQGLDVVCATISMFHECHEWNRANLFHYKEIYLRAPMPVLEQRDQRGLYSRAGRGEVSNVMGVDLPIEEPLAPDAVLDNDGSAAPDEMVSQLWKTLAL